MLRHPGPHEADDQPVHQRLPRGLDHVLVQVADGALGNVTDMLQRMRDLAVQASNGTLTDAQRERVRAIYDAEVAFMDREIGRLLEALDDELVLAPGLVQADPSRRQPFVSRPRAAASRRASGSSPAPPWMSR